MNDDPGSTSLHIEVAILDAAWADSVRDAEALACRAARAAVFGAGLPEALAGVSASGTRAMPEVSIVLSDDSRVRELNKTYRHKNAPTNVLSFPALDSQDEMIAATERGQPLILGDVILARETLLREAQEQGKVAEDHLCHLVVHGVLHLLGYDHIEDGDAGIMEGLEADVLATLEIANPYDAAQPAEQLAQVRSR